VKISADALRSIQSKLKMKETKRTGAKKVRVRKDSDTASAFDVPEVDLLGIVKNYG